MSALFDEVYQIADAGRIACQRAIERPKLSAEPLRKGEVGSIVSALELETERNCENLLARLAECVEIQRQGEHCLPCIGEPFERE